MSARREKRLRSLERRVSKLEVDAARGYLRSNLAEYQEKLLDAPVDAFWTRTPSVAEKAEPPRRSLWQRLTEAFRKGRRP